MRLAPTALALAALAQPAAADAPRYWQFSFAELGGVTSGAHGTGVVFGFRPEAILVGNARGGGAGIGAYGELATENGHAVAGAGLQLARFWRGTHVAIAPSLGAVAGAGGGLAAGLFVGRRVPNEIHIDGPIGLRLDGHFHADGSADVVFAAHLDLVAAAALGVALAAVVHRHH